MRFPALIAAALVALTALPAYAQSDLPPTVADAYEQGDWWWIDVSGSGPQGTLLLVNGEPARKGDVVELQSYTIYREPTDKGIVGARIVSHVDCAAKTDAAEVRTIFYAGEQMREIPAYSEGPKPLDPSTVYFKFACGGDRTHAHHIGRGSRSSVATTIFTEHPPR